MENFETELILNVQQHACLYNKNLSDYRNRTKKYQSWDEISNNLNKSPEQCKNKWVNLRDTFYRLYKQHQNMPPGSRHASYVRWKHFNRLQFLGKFAKSQDVSFNFSANTSDTCSNQEQVDPLPPPMHEVIIIKEENDSYTDKSSEVEYDCSQQMDVEEKNDPVNNLVNDQLSPSPLQQFFSSIASQTQRLSRRKQLKMQMMCLKALAEVELEDSDIDLKSSINKL